MYLSSVFGSNLHKKNDAFVRTKFLKKADGIGVYTISANFINRKALSYREYLQTFYFLGLKIPTNITPKDGTLSRKV